MHADDHSANGTDALPPSLRVVETVATLTNTDPTELPPLYDAVDPEALDRLLTNPDDQEVRISFYYHGFDVTVQGDGSISIQPTTDGSDILGSSDVSGGS